MVKHINVHTKKYMKFFSEHHALMIEWSRRKEGKPDSFYIAKLKALFVKYNYA